MPLKKTTWGRLSLHSKWAIIGFVVMILGLTFCGFLTNVIRLYTVRGEHYTQTVGDLVYYMAIDFCLLTWAVSIRKKCTGEKLTRHIMQLATDYFIWDMLFLLMRNPYEWDKSKLLVYGCSTVTWVVIYYLEYVSLVRFNLVDKIKRFLKKW